jgi:hypothetical protein
LHTKVKSVQVEKEKGSSTLSAECPNIVRCDLAQHAHFAEAPERLAYYTKTYCRHPEKFSFCRRYQVKMALGFCPVFVLPDSTDDLEQIMDLFDMETKE